MGLPGHLLLLARLTARTAARRLRRGPLRPSWSFAFETAMAFMASSPPTLGPESIPARRAAMESLPAFKLVPRGLATFSEVSANGVPALWVTPRAGAGDAVALYLHGGGFVQGSAHLYRAVTAPFAAGTGLRALVIDYRLAPEHPYPAALEDARAAYRWLLQQGHPPARVVVCGDSAGGGLALQLLVSLAQAGEPLPAGALLLSPWVDLACEGPSHEELAPFDMLTRADLLAWGRMYAGDLPLADPRVSPLHANLSGLPPLYVQGGGVELFRDALVTLAERVRAAGGEVTLDLCEDLPHVPCALGALHPGAKAAMDRAMAAARRMIEAAPALGQRSA